MFYFTSIGSENLSEKEIKQNIMHAINYVENVWNDQSSAEIKSKLLNIQTVPNLALAKLFPLYFITPNFFHSYTFDYTNLGEPWLSKYSPTLQCYTQLGYLFWECAHATYTSQIQQQLFLQYLQMRREQLSSQILNQKEITILLSNFRRQGEKTTQDLNETHLEMYRRTRGMINQIEALRKIQALHSAQSERLQRELAYRELLLQIQSSLQIHTIFGHLQYQQIQRLEEQVRRLQWYLAKTEVLIQLKQVALIHYLNVQKRFQAEIEHRRREQRNNSSCTRITTQRGRLNSQHFFPSL